MRLRALLAGLLLLAVTACQAPPAAEPPALSEPPQDSTPAAPLPAPKPPLPAAPPSVTLNPETVFQGGFAVLQLDRVVPGGAQVTVEGLAEQPRLYALGGKPVAFVGIPANARPGEYPVTVRWADGSWTGSLTVAAREFTEDWLEVTEEQEALYYDPRQEEEWRRVFAARSQSLDRALWRGAFRPPLDGELRITTHFGEIRFVNGVETGRHSGMDFAADTGTPILAPAPGRVVLAEPLIVTGWTIILDHGLNLYTAYYHCDRVDVIPGQRVETGQQIGVVGSTGFSTGPHLHWTATIGNTPVDPWPLTLESPLGIGPPPRPKALEE